MRHGFEDLDLDRLRRRRSQKWRAFPPDVLPAFIAEMDYDLAEPVVTALRSAWVDVSRLGLGPDPAKVFVERGRLALGDGRSFGAPGEGHVRVTIGTSSTLLAEIVDRMAAAVG